MRRSEAPPAAWVTVADACGVLAGTLSLLCLLASALVPGPYGGPALLLLLWVPSGAVAALVSLVGRLRGHRSPRTGWAAVATLVAAVVLLGALVVW